LPRNCFGPSNIVLVAAGGGVGKGELCPKKEAMAGENVSLGTSGAMPASTAAGKNGIGGERKGVSSREKGNQKN